VALAAKHPVTITTCSFRLRVSARMAT
jgi:hypothetical protein